MLLMNQYQNSMRDKNDWIDRLIKQSSRTNKNNVINRNVGKLLQVKQNQSEYLKQQFSAIHNELPHYDKLIVIENKKLLFEFELRHSHSEIIIGSHPMANIVLHAPKVLPFHCKISGQNGDYFLQDLGSQCGTYLNGKKMTPKHSIELQNAASIRIMAFQIRLELINNTATTVSKTQNTFANAQQLNPKTLIESSHKNHSNLSVETEALQKNNSWKKNITELLVTEIRCDNNNVKTFRLVATSPFDFSYLPGQFINLLLTINGKHVQRCYSISSSPSRPQTLDITVKRVPGGLVSNWLCDQVKVGDTLNIKSPRGNFSHLLKPTKKLLFIGAGSGVAPLMSMLRWQFDTGSKIESKAIFSFKNTKDILFNKEIQWINDVSHDIDIKITLTQLNNRIENGWEGLSGRVDTPILTSLISDIAQTDIYLCGPEEFMNKVKKSVKNLGFPEEQIHSEYFTHPEKKALPLTSKPGLTSTFKDKSQNKKNPTNKTTHHKVTFTKSNKVIQVDENTTLLAMAEKENLDIEFSCKAGFCAECMIKCTSGQVRMDDKCEIDEHEREQGWIFSCCSYAQSDLIIEA